MKVNTFHEKIQLDTLKTFEKTHGYHIPQVEVTFSALERSLMGLNEVTMKNGTPNNGTPYPYYSHTTPIRFFYRYWNNMGSLP